MANINENGFFESDDSKFFITGNKGFIGSWLTKQTNALGMDSKDCDIRDYESLKKLILNTNPTHLIHLAAIANPETCEKNPKLAFDVNVLGTENVLKICEKASIKPIIISTAMVYKESNNTLKENDSIKTEGNVYIKTKLECEKLANHYGATIIRPFNQEGPGRPKEYFTSKVILSCMNNEPLKLWNPNQRREYMDVRDGALGIHLISLKGKGIYNLSTGFGISKLEYVKLAEKTLGKKIDYEIEKNESQDSIIGNNDKLKKLGWIQKYSLEQTMLDQLKTLNH